uniref:CMP-sialic acid transporter 3-like n=1 Tax=Rhizophora mucronata TaxID=61149 RepID=A0A2P2MQG2_RHIMU
MPVKMVAIVEEYFLRIVSAYLKKNEDKIPWAALLNIKSIVAFECPSKMLKLPGPFTMAVARIPRKLNIAP